MTAADAYAELSRRGWGVRRIANECETNRETVRVMVAAVTRYPVTGQRPDTGGE